MKKKEDMTPEEIEAYNRGVHVAATAMLRQCLFNLPDSHEKSTGFLIAEREEMVQTLRWLCKDFGDNDWKADQNLADVIEKHLGKHLYARKGE